MHLNPYKIYAANNIVVLTGLSPAFFNACLKRSFKFVFPRLSRGA